MVAFSDWSKEQKQYLVLGVLAGAALLYGLYFLGGKVLTSKKAARKELEEISEKIEEAELTTMRGEKIANDLGIVVNELSDTMAQYAPQDDNRFSWVTELIYDRARSWGIEVESIDELGRDIIPEGVEPPFLRYPVRVVFRCGYTSLEDFLATMEKENPLLRISKVDISVDGDDPVNHSILVIMEWPTGMKIENME